MKLLGIGEFARQSRLSPKALRIYDDMGILPPARTCQPCHRARCGALAASRCSVPDTRWVRGEVSRRAAQLR
jgi:hypothetical protein